MAECMSLACPRLRNPDPDNRALSINVPSSLITRTKSGHTFCNYCEKQRRLLDWAHKRQYPAIRARGERAYYAIAEGEWQWVTSIIANCQDAIDAFYAETGCVDEPEEEIVPVRRLVRHR